MEGVFGGEGKEGVLASTNASSSLEPSIGSKRKIRLQFASDYTAAYEKKKVHSLW